MTPSGIEPATFRLVAQQLNHCATAVPTCLYHCKLTKNKSVGRKIGIRVQSERIKSLPYLLTERVNNIQQRKKERVKYICLNKWKEQTV